MKCSVSSFVSMWSLGGWGEVWVRLFSRAMLAKELFGAGKEWLAGHKMVVIRVPIINVKAFYLLSAVLQICMAGHAVVIKKAPTGVLWPMGAIVRIEKGGIS